MDFESFLSSKKIDPKEFLKSDKEQYNIWESEFIQMHPKSFEARKLFLINQIRRKYKLKIVPEAKKAERPVVKAKTTAPNPKTGVRPKFKAVIKPKSSSEDKEDEKKPNIKPVIKPKIKR